MLVLSTSTGRLPLTTPRSRAAAADTYHHGNLRQALLDHAVELAREGGPDAVVLRDVQRLAGVSNSAAYRHYSDRKALLDAVTQYAEHRLSDTMIASLTAVPDDGPPAERALSRFRATGQAYIDFALAEPGLFRTAFAPLADHEAVDSDAATEGIGAAPVDRHPFQILMRSIDALVAAGIVSKERREGLDEAAWAAVHGVATLFLDGPLAAADAERKQLITDRLLDVFDSGTR